MTSIDADVGVADGGGADAEERLAGAGRRVCNVIDADPARLVKDERFQGLPPRSAIARLGLLGAAGAAGPRLRWGALTGWGLFRRGLRDLQLVRETGLPARRVVGMQDAFVGRPVKDRARPAHTILLRAGIPVVEHLCGLDVLPRRGFRFRPAFIWIAPA